MAFTIGRAARVAAVAAAAATAAPATAGAVEPTVTVNPNAWRVLGNPSSAVMWSTVRCNLGRRATLAVGIEQDQDGSVVAAGNVFDGGPGPFARFWCLGIPQPVPILLSTAGIAPSQGAPTYGSLRSGPATLSGDLYLQTAVGDIVRTVPFGPTPATVH